MIDDSKKRGSWLLPFRIRVLLNSTVSVGKLVNYSLSFEAKQTRDTAKALESKCKNKDLVPFLYAAMASKA